MRSKWKRTAGQLTGKERRILAMAKRIDREAARIRRGLSPWFYTHGWVTLAEAAKRLRCDAEGIEALIKKCDGPMVWWVNKRGEAGEGYPKGTRLIPISELRRVMERRAKMALDSLARQAWEILKPQVPELEKLSPRWVDLVIPPKLDIVKIAERLRITPRKARALINANGPVSLAAYYSGRSLVVSPQELEAFEKAHRREIERMSNAQRAA